jgi:hypothetical protein
MDALLVGAAAMAVIGVLVVKIMILRARIDGMRVAQQQMFPASPPTGGLGYRLFKALALIGFLTICGGLVFFGVLISGG